jgi:hypothetical protein
MITLTDDERAVLLTLMAHGGQADADDLASVLGRTVPDRLHQRLDGAGLTDTVRLTSRRFGTALTDAGWYWCTQELAAAPRGSDDPLEGALYHVLAMIGRFLDARDMSLGEFITLAQSG